MTKNFIRAVLRTTLEVAEYEVTEHANGRQGLSCIAIDPHGFGHHGHAMPELNGLDMILEVTREYLDASGGASRGTANLPEAL
jgi:hypothetical protein